MSAVLLRLRSELRTRRRSMAGLALLLGLGGGIVIAAAAGARRTDTAYPRFLQTHKGADFFAAVTGGDFPVDRIGSLPQVASIEPVRWAVIDFRGNFVIGLARSRDPLHADIDRVKIVEGRAPDPRRADEVVASLLGAAKGLRVGQTFPLVGFPKEEAPDFASLSDAYEKRPMTMRVVGVAAAPGGFPPQVSEASPLIYLTPAFFRLYPNAFEGSPDSALVRLKNGLADLPAFGKELGRLQGGEFRESLFDRPKQDQNVQRSFHLQAVALWILAGLAALAFHLIFSQTLARQVFLESDDHPTLLALGLSRVQIWTSVLIRMAAAALGGAILAVILAVALSPLTPTGLARTAEPSPGVALDWTALTLGALAVVVATMLLTAFPAWRATAGAARANRLGMASPAEPRSAMASIASRAGVGASMVAGVRLALERGRGRTAIPVRTTFAGVTLGIAALVTAFTFGASLDHLLGTPRLYGVPWDMVVESSGHQTSLSGSGGRVLQLPGVRGVSIGEHMNLRIGSDELDLLAVDQAAGTSVLPPLLEGRAPRASATAEPEIVLGTRTLHRHGLDLGDTVEVRVLDEDIDKTLRMRVVGRGVLPAFNESARLGDGAMASFRALVAALGLDPSSPTAGAQDAYLDLRPGVDHQKLLAKMAELLGTKVDEDLFEPPYATAADVANFGRVQNMPLILGAFLALFAAATLAHTLVTSIRRRRRDLAILKTLGFVRGQVRRAVAVQASTVTVAALLVGIPVGVAAGRWVWTFFAHGLGVVPQSAVPLFVVLMTIPGALFLANLIAALPARAAAQTHPAIVLRSE
jgi:hypothetical protein